MNYEKKYKEALERARVYHTGGSISDDHITEVIFPELKESEDERIRKEIIDFLRLPHPQFVGKRDHEKWIAWLDKQDGKIHNMTYNPTDKVKPEFKVGDFIANDYCSGKVIEITNDAYLLDTGQGIPFSCEHNAHLWTIEDAKDGDVLVDEDNNIGIYIGKNDDFWYSCIYLGCDGCLHGINIGAYHKHNNTKPATKEQRELLFQKMEKAGYEWDSEKKELKKIKSKTLDVNKVIGQLLT